MRKRRSDNDEVFTEEGGDLSPSSSTICWLKSLIILIVLIGYLFAGAAVFRALEQPPARRAAERFQNVLLQLAEKNECMDDVAVNELMDIVTRAIGDGAYDPGFAKMLDVANESNLEGDWTLENSFMFSFTVVTTIGYGNIAPRTKLGEFICVLYAVFGIPMMAALLYTISEILQFLCSRHSQAIKKLCSCVILSHPRVKKLLLIVNGIVVAYTVLALLPSVILVYTQGWSFIVSNYYSVIVLSTIGLGDLVPDYHGVTIQFAIVIKCLVYVYFFICLGLISMLLNIVSRKQARVGVSLTRTVGQYTFWNRLQNQFQKGAPEAGGEEQGVTISTSTDVATVRKLSASERWAKIRMSVDHSDGTHEAIQRIRRRSEITRMKSWEEEEKTERDRTTRTTSV